MVTPTPLPIDTFHNSLFETAVSNNVADDSHNLDDNDDDDGENNIGDNDDDNVEDDAGDAAGDAAGDDAGDDAGDSAGNNVGDAVGDDAGNDVEDDVGNNVGDYVGNDDTPGDNNNAENQPESSTNTINLMATLTSDVSSDTGVSVNDTNLASQLLNIYESTNAGLNYQSIKEQYIDQFNYMNAMGFNDYHKIIIALYVCEGDRQAAINYYLS